jgi:hypothetical protein
MKIFDTRKFIGGWFVGNFEPTAYKTQVCEVSYKTHYAGEKWPAHYHKIADEINYLISGVMEIGGQRLQAPVVFVIAQGEISTPIFLTDVQLIVVKLPSVPNDKYEVTN